MLRFGSRFPAYFPVFNISRSITISTSRHEALQMQQRNRWMPFLPRRAAIHTQQASFPPSSHRTDYDNPPRLSNNSRTRSDGTMAPTADTEVAECIWQQMLGLMSEIKCTDKVTFEPRTRRTRPVHILHDCGRSLLNGCRQRINPARTGAIEINLTPTAICRDT